MACIHLSVQTMLISRQDGDVSLADLCELSLGLLGTLQLCLGGSQLV